MLFEVFPGDDRVVVKNGTRAVDIHVHFLDFREPEMRVSISGMDSAVCISAMATTPKTKRSDTALEEKEKAERKQNAGVSNGAEGENLGD